MTILALNTGDSAEKIKKYFAEKKFTFTPLRLKQARETGNAYGVMAVPTNYVLSGERKVSERTVGFDEDKMRAALEKLAPKKEEDPKK